MYTSWISWIIAFLLLFIFASVVGYLFDKNGKALIFLLFLVIFIISAVIIVRVVESTITRERNDSARHAVLYEKADWLLSNRYNLTEGWYKVLDQPSFRRIFPNDTTEYVILRITDNKINMEVAFPQEGWRLIPPKPEVKWLGERWVSVSSPLPSLKEIRIEGYEGREYGTPEPRVVEARTYF